jgi:AcrR family transcriptional regulator
VGIDDHFLARLDPMAKSSQTGAAPAERGLRADAAGNRRRIVEAARAVFAEHGIGAPLDEVARRAEVGRATLHRRFPTRDALVAAAFEDRMAEYAEAAVAALAEPDPWTGFRGFVERVCAMQARDRGARDVLTMSFPHAKGLEELRDRAYRDFVAVIGRAQAAGQLRADFVPEDLVMLQMANAGLMRGLGEHAPSAWQRFVGLVLDGCRADAAHPLPAPPSPPD